MRKRRLAGPGFRGLLSSRQGALALALLCALAATAILVFALGRYRHNVTAAAKQNTVLVATGLIQKGASGDVIATQQLFRPTPIVATQAVAGALSDSSFVRGKVAVNDILPGQQLTATDFASQAGIATQLAPGQRAVAVTLDAAHGLTSVVQAGDHVDVYGSFTTQNTPFVGLIVSDALVLETPGAAGSGSGAAASSTLLAMSNTQAPELAYAFENGKIWLVLRPGNATGAAPGLTTLASIYFGSHPSLSPSPNLTSTSTGAHP